MRGATRDVLNEMERNLQVWFLLSLELFMSHAACSTSGVLSGCFCRSSKHHSGAALPAAFTGMWNETSVILQNVHLSTARLLLPGGGAVEMELAARLQEP